MAEYKKPIPQPDPHSQPFWDGAKEGKLMLPRCTTCNRVHWYPRLICPFCHSRDIEWIQGSGEGRIHTFAVQHRAFGGWADEVPFVTAYIDLNEGDRMLTVLRGVDPNKPESIKIGAPVSWPKAMRVLEVCGGEVLTVTEAEIAEALAIRPGTVKSRLSRGRELLARSMRGGETQ